MPKLNIRIDSNLDRRLRNKAAAMGVTVSWLVRFLIEQKLDDVQAPIVSDKAQRGEKEN